MSQKHAAAVETVAEVTDEEMNDPELLEALAAINNGTDLSLSTPEPPPVVVVARDPTAARLVRAADECEHTLGDGRGDDEAVRRYRLALCRVRPVVQHTVAHSPLAFLVKKLQCPTDVEVAPGLAAGVIKVDRDRVGGVVGGHARYCA